MKSQDICEKITAAIIAELEKGVMPWSKPWAGLGGPVMPRRHSGERYRGINIPILWGKPRPQGIAFYRKFCNWLNSVEKTEQAYSPTNRTAAPDATFLPIVPDLCGSCA